MSFWSALGHAYKDVVGAAGSAEQWFEQRLSDAGRWVEGVFDGHPDAQATSIAEIVKQIQSGYGSSDLHQGAQVANDQTSKQMAISDGSHDLVQRLESAWSGQGADAARANIRPLAVSADDASQTLSSNGQHIQTQADTFDQIKNSLQPMADPAPDKNWYDNFVPWTTDAEKAVDQYNQQAQQNQQIYDQYHQSSTAVGQAIQIDYGHLPDAQDAQVSDFQLDNSQQGKSGTPDHNGPGSTSSGGPGPSRYQAPPGSSDYSLPAASAHPASGPTGSAGSPPSYSMPSTSGYNDATSTSGFTGNNSSYSPPGSGPGSFGPTGGGGYDPSGGGITAVGFGPMGGGFGAAGGGGAGGGYGVGGGGTGAGGALQAGGRVGAGESGSYAARPGAASAAGAAGAAGSAGSAGRPGMSGMGGAHGKGEGGEDEEHETKYLISEDGDETFGTDEKTAPPVIGL